MIAEKITRAGPILLALLSFLLFATAFLSGAFWLIFICFVPFFRALSLASTLKRSFLLGYFYGIFMFALAFFWLTNVYWPIYIFAFLFEAVFVGFFAAGFFFLNKERNILGIISCAGLWVVLEFIRSQGPLGMPVGLVGYSLSAYLPLIQIAAIGGVYALSFYVVVINCLLYCALAKNQKPLTRALIFLFVFILIAGNLFLGRMILKRPSVSSEIKIALVQGDISPSLKWNPAFLQKTIAIHQNLSLQVLKENPSLIIWPETAVPCFFFHPERRMIQEEMVRFVQRVRCPILLGTQDFWIDHLGKHVHNLAVLLDADGTDIGRYAKRKLIPFVERPFWQGLVPFLRQHGVSSVYDAGREDAVFSLQGTRFSTIICFEGLFPESVRRLVLKGAQFIVNITNDAPSLGRMRFFYEQNARMLIVRAVENRRAIVRAANDGISCFIDPQGRILREIPLFCAGAVSAEIPREDSLTFYSRHGDWFVGLCGLLFFIHFLLIFLKSSSEQK